MGQFLADNESHIYPNMCAKFGCGPTVVSKKKWGGYRQSDKGTLQLYIVDNCNYGNSNIDVSVRIIYYLCIPKKCNNVHGFTEITNARRRGRSV